VSRWPWIVLSSFALSCSPKGAEKAPSTEEREPEAPRTVSLSGEALRAAQIETAAVSRERFVARLLAPGVIQPDAQRSVTVRAPAGGRVLRVLVDLGSRVDQGQPLATLEGSDATAALARRRTAAAREAAARRALERADRLLEIQAISRADRDARLADAEAASAEAEAAQQDLARLGLGGGGATEPGRPAELTIIASLAGTVLERSVSPGLLVEKEASLFVIAGLAQVWAVVDVYEKDLGDVADHGEAEVRTDADPEMVFKGRVALVEPALDAASRVAHVRLVLDNVAGKLRPGLLVTAALPRKSSPGGEGLAVPRDAVQRISGLPAVFVEREGDRFELRSIEIGRESGGMVEVLKGLEGGEKVVVRGAFMLKSELLKGTLEAE
jgi:cobalt-zinc-cadmium efflux system membrane fusion protein